MSTYNWYGSPDAVAAHWTRAIRYRAEWVEKCFGDYRAGLITLEQLERKCIPMQGPVDDDTMNWAESAFEKKASHHPP